MLNLINRTQVLVLAVSTAAFVFTSNLANAEIYKWSNARGVIQYSDKPPAFNLGKATRNEVVNALQSKDLCTTGPVVKKTALASFLIAGGSKSSINQYKPLISSSTMLAGNTVVTIYSSLNKPLNSAKYVAPVNSATTTTTTTTSPTTTTTLATSTISPTTTSSTITPSSTSIRQVALMPAVDTSKNMIPAIGYDTLRVQPTTELTPTSDIGAFRIVCTPSKMSNDDPIVYPNQPGAAHHHTFFGNTSINATSDLMALHTTGNSTCNGGIMNRSAYWVPSIIDTSTNTPIKPTFSIFYYKSGYTVPANLITPPPNGLRIISGNSKSISAATSSAMFSCYPPAGVDALTWKWSKSIYNCPAGWSLEEKVVFPQCWDGINLDSPDHKSHMAFADGALSTANKCPSTHPIAIPEISINAQYIIASDNQALNWRLASDNYDKSSPGGFSSHADWVNGWDQNFISGIVKNCINTNSDCHAHLLGDGRMFY